MEPVPTMPGCDGVAAALTFESSFLVGELVAERFRVRRLLAGGGFSEVYEARDVIFEQDVALKVLYPGCELEGPCGLDHLRREVLFARRVTHPHVCRVHDAVIHRPPGGPERLVVTMELLDGPTLESWLHRHGALRLSRAIPWIGQLAEALDAAHRSGVLHLDLKPGNVVLASGGAAMEGERRAVITDFGLARPVVASEDPAARGTPGFMAPEQEHGEAVGPAADLYAFGAVVHALLTGGPPGRVGEAEERVSRGLEPAVQDVLRRALAPDPAERFPDAAGLARALRLAAGIDAPSTLPTTETVLPRRRSRMLLGGLLVLAILAGAATVPVAWLEPPARSPAEGAFVASDESEPVEAAPEVRRAVAEARGHLRHLDGASARQVLAGLEGDGLGWPTYHGALSEALWLLGHEEESRSQARAAYLAAGQRRGLERVERLVHEARWRARSFDWPAAARLYDAAWTYTHSSGASGSVARQPDVGLELVHALERSRELERARVVLDELRALEPGRVDPRVELAAAALAENRSDHEAMAEHARRALRVAGAGAPVVEAHARLLLGVAQLQLLRREAAVDQLEQARRLFSEAGNRSLVGVALQGLAQVHERAGRPGPARAHFQESIALQREVGSERRLPIALHAFAAFQLRLGSTEAAVPLLEEAHALFQRIRDVDEVAAVIGDRALLSFNRGRVEEATELFEEALELNRRLGRKRGQITVLNNLAEAYLSEGQLERATAAWQEGVAVAREAGERELVLLLSANLTKLAWMQGRFGDGRELLEPVLATEDLHPQLAAYARYLGGKLSLAEGRETRAEGELRQAAELARSTGFTEQADLIAVELAELWSDQERHDDAVSLASEAWERLRSSANPLYQQHGAAAAISTLVAGGRVDRAREVLERIQELNPASVDRPCARLSVAQAELELAGGSPERARTLVRAALETVSVDRSLALDLRAWSLLARAQEALGETEAAAAVREQVHGRAEQHQFSLGCWAYRQDTGTVKS